MSVRTACHLTMFPRSSHNGAMRTRNQRYSPSMARRSLTSFSNGFLAAAAERNFSTFESMSSWCTERLKPSESVSPPDIPLYSLHCLLSYALHPSHHTPHP